MSQRGLEYIGKCQKELKDFPEEVQEQAIFALLAAQIGEKHQDAVPLKGFPGASVLEIRLPHRTDTYRVIYTTGFAEVVYALCAFKKKSTTGIATPKRYQDLIKSRLRTAEELHARRATRD